MIFLLLLFLLFVLVMIGIEKKLVFTQSLLMNIFSVGLVLLILAGCVAQYQTFGTYFKIIDFNGLTLIMCFYFFYNQFRGLTRVTQYVIHKKDTNETGMDVLEFHIFNYLLLFFVFFVCGIPLSEQFFEIDFAVLIFLVCVYVILLCIIKKRWIHISFEFLCDAVLLSVFCFILLIGTRNIIIGLLFLLAVHVMNRVKKTM